MVLKYNLKNIYLNMKTRGMIIVRYRRALNNKGEEVLKKEYLRCRFNAAVPDSHKMLAFERQLAYEMR